MLISRGINLNIVFKFAESNDACRMLVDHLDVFLDYKVEKKGIFRENCQQVDRKTRKRIEKAYYKFLHQNYLVCVQMTAQVFQGWCLQNVPSYSMMVWSNLICNQVRVGLKPSLTHGTQKRKHWMMGLCHHLIYVLS